MVEKEPLVFKVSPEETRLLHTGHPLSYPCQNIGQIHALPEIGTPSGELLLTLYQSGAIRIWGPEKIRDHLLSQQSNTKIQLCINEFGPFEDYVRSTNR